MDKETPKPYTWARHRWSIRRHLGQTQDASNFLTWSTLHATMFVAEAPYISNELDELMEWEPIKAHPEILDETEFGGAPRLSYMPSTSGNLVHQAYHLYMWAKTTGLDINDVNGIVEYGGGYGAMVLLAYRLGFKGNYHIIDLPEFTLLQKYYLSNVLPLLFLKDMRLTFSDYPKKTFSNKQRLTFSQHPGWIPSTNPLLIACYSFSEVPVKTRNKFLLFDFSSYLIAYQDRYDDIDNNEYFRNFAYDRNTTCDIEWHSLLKDIQPGHSYLIGKKYGIY